MKIWKTPGKNRGSSEVGGEMTEAIQTDKVKGKVLWERKQDNGS